MHFIARLSAALITYRQPQQYLKFPTFFLRRFSGYPLSGTFIDRDYSKGPIYDFRSDTATIPTDAMFDVMKAASLGDDVLSEDKSTNDLEAYVAELTGHEAALFATSGTMTNQLAIRAHLSQPPHSVLVDARSHIYNYEAGGIASHSHALVIPVDPINKEYLTPSEIESHIIQTNDVHYAPTRLICLENTVNGLIIPLSEITAISAMAREKGIKLHLDGSRLWNASVETGVSLKEYGRYFDSMSLCLSKGIGAPIGSILTGNKRFINQTRHLRKMFGGGWRQSGPLAAAARFAIQTTFPDLIKKSNTMARNFAIELQKNGINILTPVQTNMIFIDTSLLEITTGELKEDLARNGILIDGDEGTKTRIIVHYQITQEAVDRFLEVVNEFAKGNNLFRSNS